MISQITTALAKARTQLMLSGVNGAFHGALAMSLIPIIRPDIETAATDGAHFFYNGTWFDSLSERERVGVLVHEIRHLLALHHCRRNGRDLDEFNIAADYALNPGIVADGFKLPADVLLDPQYAGLSAEEIFRMRQVQRQTEQDEKEQAESDSQESEQSQDESQSQSNQSQEDSSDNDNDESSSESGNDESSDASDNGQNDSGNDQDDSGNDQGNGESESSDQDGQGDNGPNDANGQGDGKQGDESSQGSGNAENDHLSDPSEFSANIPEPSQELTAEDFENMAAEQADKQARRNPISDPGACGGIMDAAPASDPAAMAQAESDMAQRIRQAIAVARKANGGTLPEDLARLVGELNKPKLDARDVLRRFIDRSISKSFDWTRPNRRYLSKGLILPSLMSDRPGHVVALVDVSGSLWSQSAQAALTSELQGALDNGAADKITIVYADTDVTGSAEYFPGDQIIVAGNGGGGTDFRAPLQWVADHCDDAAAILYLTDMQTLDFGAEPDAPLLWLVYGNPRDAEYWIDRAPFGEAIYIDE